MVNETIQYYIENGGQAVYLLLLDASKAFDKVSYEKLFELLLARNVCPKIVKLLYLRHEIFPEFSGIPEFLRPQRSFSWKSQIRFNIYGGGGGVGWVPYILCAC